MLYHVSAEWTPEDVAERFLKPCGMEGLAKTFIDANVTGNVLIALQESHLKELGCDRVGDRLTLMDYLHVSLHASEEPLWLSESVLHLVMANTTLAKNEWFTVQPFNNCAVVFMWHLGRQLHCCFHHFIHGVVVPSFGFHPVVIWS